MTHAAYFLSWNSLTDSIQWLGRSVGELSGTILGLSQPEVKIILTFFPASHVAWLWTTVHWPQSVPWSSRFVKEFFVMSETMVTCNSRQLLQVNFNSLWRIQVSFCWTAATPDHQIFATWINLHVHFHVHSGWLDVVNWSLHVMLKPCYRCHRASMRVSDFHSSENSQWGFASWWTKMPFTRICLKTSLLTSHGVHFLPSQNCSIGANQKIPPSSNICAAILVWLFSSE